MSRIWKSSFQLLSPSPSPWTLESYHSQNSKMVLFIKRREILGFPSIMMGEKLVPKNKLQKFNPKNIISQAQTSYFVIVIKLFFWDVILTCGKGKFWENFFFLKSLLIFLLLQENERSIIGSISPEKGEVILKKIFCEFLFWPTVICPSIQIVW